MSFNLPETVKGYFTNELIGKASAYLGESESGVTKAISGILPSFLGGLINKSSSPDGARSVAQLAQEQHQSGVLDNLSSLFGGQGSDWLSKGANVLAGLFGGKADAMSQLISNFSGIKSSSASSLMSMAAPAVLGFLGKHAADNNLDAGSLASLLGSQKATVNAAIPSGLNLSGILDGFGSRAAAGTTAAVTPAAESTTEETGGAMKILLPLLLLVLLALGAWYFFRGGCAGCNNETAVTDSAQAEKLLPESTRIQLLLCRRVSWIVLAEILCMMPESWFPAAAQ